MPWVVKSFKPEVVQAAEREARRVRREAAREAANAAAYLLVLEELGSDLREGLRRQRRAAPGHPEPLPVPAKRPAPAACEIKATRGRATLRDSPLTDLFRATG